MTRELRVFPNLTALSEVAAAEFVRSAGEALATRGRWSVALAGGNTPRSLYRLLAELPAGAIDWSRTDIFWGDERCVAPDDRQSNYAMAHQALLSRIDIPPERVHRIMGERPPVEAAAAYDQLLRERLPSTIDGGAPVFDLVLLGMGADGHVASLFAGDPALDERERWAVAVGAPPGYPVSARVTLTLPVLNVARLVVVLVAGADKQAAIEAVLGDTEHAPRYPAALVRPTSRLLWLLDHAAAELLERTAPE